MEKNKKLRLIVFAAICLVFVSLRLWRLTDSCLRFDEIFGIHAAEHDWQNLFSFVALDLIHPPLFYVLLKLWVVIGGENLVWLRLFSVLFSTVSLAPLYLLCRQLKLNFSTIAIALAFFAANGSLIKYAQEIRMYSLLLCLSLFSVWLFTRFFFLGKSFAPLVVVNVLLIYAHYFGWLAVASEVAAILILQRAKSRRILIMFAISAASFAPWLFAVWRATRTADASISQNLGWADRPNISTVFQFVFDLIEPFYFQQTNIDASSIFVITIPLFLIFLAAYLLFLFDWKILFATEKEKFYLLSIFCVAPVLFAFIASWVLPVSVWGTRHLIIAFPPAAILTAIILERIKIHRLKLAALGLIFWLTAMAFLLQAMRGAPVLIVCAWENLANDLQLQTEQNQDTPTRVFLFEDAAAYSFWFALRDKENQFQIVKVNGVEGLTEDAAYFLPRGFDAIKTTDENGLQGERFFVVFRDTQWNEQKPPLKNLIEKNYKLGAPQIFEAQGFKAFLVMVEK